MVEKSRWLKRVSPERYTAGEKDKSSFLVVDGEFDGSRAFDENIGGLSQDAKVKFYEHNATFVPAKGIVIVVRWVIWSAFQRMREGQTLLIRVFLLFGFVTAAAVTAAKDVSGVWTVSANGFEGEVCLPGTLADARLGKRWTEQDFRTSASVSLGRGP